MPYIHSSSNNTKTQMMYPKDDLLYSLNETKNDYIAEDQQTSTGPLLQKFFKAVAIVDHSYKSTTENFNKLVSFYL